MKKTVAVLAALLSFPPVLWANPSISYDFQNMMQWLTHDTVQGLAFNTGSTFDPPDELSPGRWQPDVSLGVGVVPLNKAKFPAITTPALSALSPQGTFPNNVTFPDLAVHMRLGLPNRWDISVRGADMTIPKGYQMTPQTAGEGQSNSLGFGIRKHFFGGDVPRLSLAANFNHVFGHIDFFDQYKNLELAPGFVVNSLNHGQLAWDVTSIGLNAVTSQTFGAWTPFLGVGYNRMSGSVSGKLLADFQTPLIVNPEGQASSTPETYQGRLIFGTQWDRSVLSYFLNGEVKIIGAYAGKTFIVTSGIALPFGLGPETRLARRNSRRFADQAAALARKPAAGGRSSAYDTDAPAYDPGMRDALNDAPNDINPERGRGLEIDSEAKPVPVMRYREFDKPEQMNEYPLGRLPEADLIR